MYIIRYIVINTVEGNILKFLVIKKKFIIYIIGYKGG